MRFTTTAMRLELVLKQVMVLGDTAKAPICLVRRPDSVDGDGAGTTVKGTSAESLDAEPGQVVNAASDESSDVNSVVKTAVISSSEDTGGDASIIDGVKSEGDETVSVDGRIVSVEDANASGGDHAEEKEHVAGANHDTHVAERTTDNGAELQNSDDRTNEDCGVVGSSVARLHPNSRGSGRQNARCFHGNHRSKG